MILKMDEVNTIRSWDKIDLENGGIALEITIDNKQWFRYELNEREICLFKHGFNPEQVLRVYNIDDEPTITISQWKHYASDK